ncbi:hypothetical protein QO034_06605 [Sedimentitalea sp. JM2-8]|uniref:DUF6950 domain-containing protein n=1 Tax=Sedimentitalea xiamensis TaxID=3050037 RepID=A0ABT7FCC6_9RHOB|nr:hypothetical protein [Sedimentitalea xiamensis]MDK3072775.1 hypothetical protein [Sedimentitalea xiamensis]
MSRAALLQGYLSDCRQAMLRPGRHDCALFAAGWVARCTGPDFAFEWRERYRTLDEGRAALAAAGFGSLTAIAAHHLGAPMGWMAAQVGDVAVVIEDGEEAFGLVGGAFIHCLAPHRGLNVVPLPRAVRVFRP